MSKQSLAFWAVIAGSVLVAALRLTVPGRPLSSFTWNASFEAIAHVWNGGLALAALALWLVAKGWLDPARLWKPTALVALALAVYEIAAFALGYWLR